MKCLPVVVLCVLVALIPSPCSCQEQYNYLIAAYNYSVAIRGNFDEATEYYGEYLSQELEKISDRITERLMVALEAQTDDPAHGRSVSTCADSAAYAIQTHLSPVHRELLFLKTEALKLHQATNQKIKEVNLLLAPMDEFYYQFTNQMLSAYTELNEEILPKLITEVIALVAAGDGIYQNMDNCLNQI